MKIIAGLGNPGRRYQNTPHNVGFNVADLLAERWGVKFSPRRREQAEVVEAARDGEKVLLIKPLTYMNLSGHAIRELIANQPVTPADVLVVLDEANLDIGRLRIREEGTAGGHNGLKSVIECLGTQEVPRLRIGVKPNRPIDAMIDLVLGSLRPDERERVANMIEVAADAAEFWIREGTEATANKFNGYRDKPSKDKDDD